MRNEIIEIIDKQKDEIIKFGQELFRNPELGYKEFKTKEIIKNLLQKKGIEIEEEFFETGFKVSVGSGDLHIGLIAELDAVPTLNHPFSNKIDNAAHTCGHSSQVVIMTNAIIALKKISDKLKGKVTLFFTPAEEYTDLEYRRKLIEEGKINYIGGKINMLTKGVFDGVDMFIHLHAMGNEYKYGYNSSLAGFKYKKIKFIGKASHAGVLPHLGNNALNMFTLFNSALGMLRETFEDGYMTRVHGILTKGGDTINSVPSEVIYECYIRCLDFNILDKIDKQLDISAKCCANALNGDVKIYNQNGYLPFNPSKKLGEVIYKNLLKFADEKEILKDEKSIAAGDVGDVSCFFPMVQFGYNGFKGSIHGVDFEVFDEYKAYIEPSKIVVLSILDLFDDLSLFKDIKDSFKPTLSTEEYLEYLKKG
ncbi:MAG: amidohydrolase [Erysipelotrichaceae bacterium]|nr:amidohydrolase [Erysipelotrichaceae bacterium]